MDTLTLDKLPLKIVSEITTIEDSDLSQKLVEMGLYSGKKIKVLFKAPFGDPIAIDVEGYMLSLRLNEAKLLNVKKI